MREKILDILLNIRPDVDFENEKALIDDRILDSFDILAVVAELDEEFDVEINVQDLLPENFNSVEGLMDLVAKLQEE